MVSYSHSIATMAVSLSHFDTIHERDSQPARHRNDRMTAKTTLMHSVARQKLCPAPIAPVNFTMRAICSP